MNTQLSTLSHPGKPSDKAKVRKERILLGGVLLLLGTAGYPGTDQPNIVFVYSDDHGPWAIGLEHPNAHTPNIDRLLGTDGVRLINAFVTTPVCSPSRAGLFTGRYGTEVGITDWITPDEKNTGMNPAMEIPTWPGLLREAGYTTGLMGKWHLGYPDHAHPTRHGFDEFVGFIGHAPPSNPTIEKDGEQAQVEGLTMDILTGHLIDFIRRHKEKPFAVMLSARSPHRTWLPVAASDWAPYEGVDPEIPDYPGIDKQRVSRMTREYLASVTNLDRNLGRIIEELENQDLLQNTVVIFTANEGNALGHHGAWGKGNAVSVLTDPPPGTANIPGNRRPNLYDVVLRVPTGVWWPGVIEGGTVVGQTISNLDWFPTLLAIANVEIDQAIQNSQHGRNFLPLLMGEPVDDWDNTLYAEYSPYQQIRADMRAIRTPRWKLVRDFLNPWRDEFYDLENDPEEHNNLIFDNRFEVQVAIQSLHEQILEKMRQLEDPLLKQEMK